MGHCHEYFSTETSSNALIERKEMVNFILNANGYPTDVFVTTVGGVWICVCSTCWVGVLCLTQMSRSSSWMLKEV